MPVIKTIEFKKDNETEITGFFLSNEIGIDINSISIEMIREPAPIYTMGTSFSRGTSRIQCVMYISFEELEWEDIQLVFTRIEIKKNGEVAYLLTDNYTTEQSVVGNQCKILFTSLKLQTVVIKRGRCILTSTDEMINGMLS